MKNLIKNNLFLFVVFILINKLSIASSLDGYYTFVNNTGNTYYVSGGYHVEKTELTSKSVSPIIYDFASDQSTYNGELHIWDTQNNMVCVINVSFNDISFAIDNYLRTYTSLDFNQLSPYQWTMITDNLNTISVKDINVDTVDCKIANTGIIGINSSGTAGDGDIRIGVSFTINTPSIKKK